MSQPLATKTLTKQFFKRLPVGVYLTRTLAAGRGQPSFAETVAPANEREAQWARILRARVNNTLCSVFKTAADFMAYSVEVRGRRPVPGAK